jgi:hypothetical protein
MFLSQPASVQCRELSSEQNAERVRQAKKIIEDSNRFNELAKSWIAQAEKDTEKAKQLRGNAHIYDTNLSKIKTPALTGKALQAARKQFQLDLANFAKHTEQYRQHTDDVRRHFGLCQATLKAYDDLRKEFSLHCDQFHLPDVPPPHICLEATEGANVARLTAGEARDAARKLGEEQQRLQLAERNLQRHLQESGVIDRQVMQKSELALQEQNLAAEFARLKEEHRQLEVAHRAISGAPGQVVIPRVKGTIENK